MVFTEKLSSQVIKRFIGLQDPNVCFQCRRCSSGCPVAFLEKNYRPHRIVAFVNLDRIDELLKSEVIWECTRCYKCVEYCPQKVAPSDVVLALQALAAEKIGLPAEYKDMIMRIAKTGFSFEVMQVTDRELEFYDRESLGLPKLVTPSSIEILGNIVKKLGGIE
ncbi:MAG: 4Fe-4S dicluster domain-containing protein [Thermoproteales archaeon]|nr:4Fe-4S dicluster domain-containing protein [Thermoproteales archaeon]